MEGAISPRDPVGTHVASGDVFILTRSGPVVRRGGRWVRASGVAVLIVDEPVEWRAVEGEDARALRESAETALSRSGPATG